MSHAEIMRRILRVVDKDIEKAAAVYAILEDPLWPRESNVESWSSLTYARSDAHNEIRKHADLIDAIPYPH
jgi:hypothetical protein